MEEVSFRSAEDLFTELSVGEAWRVLEHTRQRQESKRQELKELVGLRYHDLIDSADAIVGMEKTVEEFKLSVKSLMSKSNILTEKKIDFLSSHINIPQSEIIQPQTHPIRVQNRLGAYTDEEPESGSILAQMQYANADYLTHAAPRIWEAVDNGNLQEATLLLLESERVYEQLLETSSVALIQEDQLDRLRNENENSKEHETLEQFLSILNDNNCEETSKMAEALSELSKGNERKAVANNNKVNNVWFTYPFLRSHWSLVKECKPKILIESKNLLNSPEYTVREYMGALFAILLVGKTSRVTADSQCESEIQALIDAFLSSRSSWIENLLKNDQISSCLKVNDDLGECEGGECQTGVGVEDVEKNLLEIMYSLKRTIVDSVKVFISETISDDDDVEENSMDKLEGSHYLPEVLSQLKRSELKTSSITLSPTASMLELNRQRSRSASYSSMNSHEENVYGTEEFAQLVHKQTRSSLKEWIKKEAERLSFPISQILAFVPSVSELASIQETLLQECVIPLKCSKECVEFDTLEGKKGNGISDMNVLLFSLFFKGAFIQRSGELMKRSFHNITTQTYNRITMRLDSNRMSPEVDNSNSNANKYYFENGAINVSDTADGSPLSRARLAFSIMSCMDFEILTIINEARRMNLVNSSETEDLTTLMGKGCFDAFSTLIDSLGKIVYAPVGSGNCSPKKGNEIIKITDIKKMLFVARICEVFRCSAAIDMLFVDEEKRKFQQRVDEITETIYDQWKEAALRAATSQLNKCLRAEKWELSDSWKTMHGGWENFAVNLEDVEDEAGSESGSDFISLPTCASSGVTFYSYELSKQIRMMGDSHLDEELKSFNINIPLALTRVRSVNKIDDDGVNVNDDDCTDEVVPVLSKENVVEADKLKTRSIECFRTATLRNCSFLMDSSWVYVCRIFKEVFQMPQPLETEEYKTTFTNEAAALQSLFDIDWLKAQLGDNAKEGADLSSAIQKEIVQIRDLLLDVHIDPVNWALYETQFTKNVFACTKKTELLFVTSVSTTASTSAHSSDTVFNKEDLKSSGLSSGASNSNLLPFSSTITRIPLLPIPSTMRPARKTMGRRVLAHGRPNAKRESLTSEPVENSNMSENVRDKAFARVSQVGSNLFSQASSWGLFNKT